MNKYELFRAFQDISPELIEDAERMTVQKPEYLTDKREKTPLFMRKYEEVIMSKHNKMFRMLTGAAAVVAMCSIGIAGYFAIRPNIAEQPDSAATNLADVTVLTTAAETDLTSAVTTTETAMLLPSDEFIEETLPPQAELDEAQQNQADEEEDDRFDDVGFSYGGGFLQNSSLSRSETKAVNDKQMSLDLSLYLRASGKQSPHYVPTTIILMQDGKILPFSLEKNESPKQSQKLQIELPEIQYTDELNVYINTGTSEDAVNRITDKIKAIDGVKDVRRQNISYRGETETLAESFLSVKLTSDLIPNDDTLYSEIFEKIKKNYGVASVIRHQRDDSDEDFQRIKVWFTPHCRENYSTVAAAIIYHTAPQYLDGLESCTFISTVQLSCENPDESSISEPGYLTAVADDLIDFPESASKISSAYGCGIGRKQNYGSDAGPNKYELSYFRRGEPEKLNRDEIYLKARFNSDMIYGTKMPKSLYALVLCDGKPLELADGKYLLKFDTDDTKTLNFNLPLDDSVEPGTHDFSCFFYDADNTPITSGTDFPHVFSDCQSCLIEVKN